MIKSPVFLTLGSNRGRSAEKSAVCEFIDVSNANSGFTDHMWAGAVIIFSSPSLTLPSNFFLLLVLRVTDTLQSILSISIKLVFLKSSTKNPVLNLVKPSASWICNVFVSNSSKLNDEVISKFSILSSNLPISLMVNLTLSVNVIIASSGL